MVGGGYSNRTRATKFNPTGKRRRQPADLGGVVGCGIALAGPRGDPLEDHRVPEQRQDQIEPGQGAGLARGVEISPGEAVHVGQARGRDIDHLARAASATSPVPV